MTSFSSNSRRSDVFVSFLDVLLVWKHRRASESSLRVFNLLIVIWPTAFLKCKLVYGALVYSSSRRLSVWLAYSSAQTKSSHLWVYLLALCNFFPWRVSLWATMKLYVSLETSVSWLALRIYQSPCDVVCKQRQLGTIGFSLTVKILYIFNKLSD